ncbi:acetolactate synthase-1/2/3 large subunit [Fodinibius roseus]|uniref:Acetolactate synthase-1/2/3 large subunit n=1 Tax=Fodinibius roseus TaxID=1194090 RepID=A0A1M5B757_9BACT|nr:acetolactate synthase large subunit [Fodinibius roseus]SHF38022.1 acetolactate synthase-1/2/3 large subunit [Fodinibius roseus]
MKVSDLFVKALENEGVQYVFGVPGEENEDLLFSLEQSSIQFVPTRHEQGAAFMADVWGRITGKAGVCLATLGPGATNLLTGIADANLDKSPVVAITGQGDLDRLHNTSHQNLDVVSMFRPVTKWNTAISTPNIVPEVVRKAFKLAEMEKPGATHIELSEDVAKADTQTVDLIQPESLRRAAPDYKALDKTIELLKKARRPLIIAGNGAIRKRASKHLTELVNAFGIPVAHTFMGKGAITDTNDLSLYAIGLGFRDYVMEAVERADLILAVGYDIAEYAPEAWNPDNSNTIVHIDFEAAEVYTHYRPEVELICDISAALWKLNREMKEQKFSFETGWHSGIRNRILEDIQSYNLAEGDDFTIPGALNIIRKALPESGLLISDVGSHKMWIARNFLTCCPNGCIISNGLATMGIALPGGIAASLADPDRHIVAAMGDGGFMMNVQELETAKRLGVGCTVIVFNDNDYGLISWKQRMHTGRSTGTRISNPDFVKLAESFGIPGYRPETVRELNDVLTESIQSRELRLVEIPINPAVNSELTDKLSDYWKNNS